MTAHDSHGPTQHLDVRAFARSGGEVGGAVALAAFDRLAADCVDGGAQACVEWSAQGSMRSGEGMLSAPWLHLRARTTPALVCQHCLEPVDTPLQVDQWFRFVPDEETAQQQDDAALEDLLVESADFDLHALLEDELLLAMPLIAHHAVCPAPPPRSAQDEAFDAATAARPAPFAALGRWRKDGGGTGGTPTGGVAG